MRRLLLVAAIAAGTCVMGSAGDAQASSHREAPFVTKNPKIDSSDFYMFRSYETGKEATVTIIANYLPLQDAYGGPNFFQLDPEALYEIHIDNDGDGGEDVTFQFQFKNTLTPAGTGTTLPVTLDLAGTPTTKANNVPLINIGGVAADNGSVGGLQVVETYTMNVVSGDRRTGTSLPVTGSPFKKPYDFTGTGTYGTVANYTAYAEKHIQPFSYGQCTGARTFVGQRREGFAGNIGPIFDLLQAGADKAGFLGAITGGGTEATRGRQANVFDTGLLYEKNVTSIAIEVPISCLIKTGGSPIIGGWTSASMRQARVLNPSASYDVPSKEGGAWTQVSHLGMPLVNEVVIGYKDKDLFSAVTPKSTAAVADYVTHPTLPLLIETVFGAAAAPAPKKVRTDLVAAFATGLTVTLVDDTKFNLTQTSTFAGAGITAPPGGAVPEGVAEYLRLNTAVAASSQAKQNGIPTSHRGLGALGCFTDARKVDLAAATCDPAGFPNGRRPGDDVLDIALRVVEGVLFATDADAPLRNVPFTDGNYNGPEQFDSKFPYLRTPLGGNQTPATQP